MMSSADTAVQAAAWLRLWWLLGLGGKQGLHDVSMVFVLSSSVRWQMLAFVLASSGQVAQQSSLHQASCCCADPQKMSAALVKQVQVAQRGRDEAGSKCWACPDSMAIELLSSRSFWEDNGQCS